MTGTKPLIRKSNFELLRLIAMFLIVLYHIFIGTYESNPDFVSQSIWIPLHLGVPVFILISGYFHIKFSWLKLLRLVSVLFIYTFGIQVVGSLVGGGKNISLMFFISRSPYWFMTVYLMLFVLSPYVNRLLESMTTKEELFIIMVLAVISIYVGGFHNFEAYSTGKNVLNFILIYSIGDLYGKNELTFNKIPAWTIVLLFVFFNLVEVYAYNSIKSITIKYLIWKMSFPYNSPFLIINAFLLFVAFSRISISSRLINWAAGSCLGIYMLHHHPVIDHNISLLSNSIIIRYSQLESCAIFVLIALLIVVISVLIDKFICIPINRAFNR